MYIIQDVKITQLVKNQILPFCKKNVTYSILKIWNLEPHNFECRRLRDQTKHSKKFLIGKCYYSVREFMEDRELTSL